MNRNFFAFLFCLLIPLLSFAQEEDTLRKRILFGTETGGTIINGRDPVSGDKIKFTNLRFGPYLGYFLSNNWILGFTGEYEYVKSNYTEAPSLYGIGFFTRYYLPFRIKKVKFLADRLLFLAEASFLKVNYYPQSNEALITFVSLQEKVLHANLGFSFRIWKQLYLEKSVRADYFINRKYRWSHRLSIEYHF